MPVNAHQKTHQNTNMLDFKSYTVLTFDCYGTLIDWESGILTAMRTLLATHHIQLTDEVILERFAEFEAALEQGEYQSYRQILQGVVQRFGEQFGFTPTTAEQQALPDSIRNWLPFADTVAALQAFKKRFKLVIISNIDDHLFADTAAHLQVEFDQVITAEQVRSYKPSLNNFQQAMQRIGVPSEQILHVAASLYHDIAPARLLGLATVWVNRRHGLVGSGAVLPVQEQPDLEVRDLKTLVDRAKQQLSDGLIELS